MKRFLIIVGLMAVCWSSTRDLQIAQVKYVNPYFRSDGTYVSGHYRDTSNDGNPYNNANSLGYNDYSY